MANPPNQSALSLSLYYQSLLILQYLNLPRASGTINSTVSPLLMPQTSVQVIQFPSAPSSGNFVLNFGGIASASIAFNKTAAQIQTILQAVTGLGSVTVTGSIAGLFLYITFTGVAPPAALLTISSNTLANASGVVTPTIFSIDMTLPFAVENAYNLIPTVQTLSFSDIAASGSFFLTYQGNTSSAISWNSTPAQAQQIIQTLVGINNPISVFGSILSQNFQISFSVPALTSLLYVGTNTLENVGSSAITILNTPNTAVGVQLDVLGEYAGVKRMGFGLNGTQITLDDTDFLTLVQLAVITNNSGSSLATIQQLLNQFFAGQILVFDYTNMRMSYLINSSLGSENLLQLFITEGLLPQPMAVQISVVSAPIINTFFGFRTYALPGFNNSPFNSYAAYTLNTPWLTYADGIIV